MVESISIRDKIVFWIHSDLDVVAAVGGVEDEVDDEDDEGGHEEEEAGEQARVGRPELYTDLFSLILDQI